MWRLGAERASVLALVACAGCGSGSDHGASAPATGTGGAAVAGSSNAGGAAGSGVGGAAIDGGGSGATDAGQTNTGGAPGAHDGGPSGGADAGTQSRDGGVNPDGGPAAGGAGADGGLGAGGAQATGGTSKKLDLLLVVDNSISMADKQTVLRVTVPDLVQKLTDTALGVEDLHVGVITSSLGSYGTTTCAGDTTTLPGEEVADMGHLVGTRPRAASVGLPSGFATWTRSSESTTVIANVQNLVAAAGEFGCGLEATLEATYRFLADPNPYLSIQIAPCAASPTAKCAFPTGTDTVLLDERAAFLRPDSAVAVVVLSDENDCSIRATDQYYYAARTDIVLPHGSAACATNPNDPCCYSCAQSPPAGCPADSTCQSPLTPGAQDPINLRCFDEKRRFGLDMLYPVERYANALRKTSLCTSRADLDASAACPDADGQGGADIVRNPLFPDPTTASGPVRDPSMVYLLGVVGVPWQSIRATKDASGAPLPPGTLRYRTGAELASDGVWPVVLGDPKASPPVAPQDPLMIESTSPRTGTTPGTGEALAPPTAGYLANSVNGHEWANPYGDDLEYACIFPLPKQRDCTAIAQLSPSPGCDCTPSSYLNEQSPLCQDATGAYSTVQGFAKSYPGLRHLALVKALGDNAAMASICARNLSDDTAADYGYRPAMEVMVTELRHTVR